MSAAQGSDDLVGAFTHGSSPLFLEGLVWASTGATGVRGPASRWKPLDVWRLLQTCATRLQWAQNMVLSLADVSGTAWSTSQCSTILPFFSRRMSAAAVPRSVGGDEGVLAVGDPGVVLDVGGAQVAVGGLPGPLVVDGEVQERDRDALVDRFLARLDAVRDGRSRCGAGAGIGVPGLAVAVAHAVSAAAASMPALRKTAPRRSMGMFMIVSRPGRGSVVLDQPSFTESERVGSDPADRRIRGRVRRRGEAGSR